jgi:hypothetical protein
MKKLVWCPFAVALICLLSMVSYTASARSGGGGGGGGGSVGVDTIKVSKSWWTNINGALLINAKSSNPAAHLYLYIPSGQYLGEVQNGSGGPYGGTVFYVPFDPVKITLVSSSGGIITVPTTPFVP